MTASTVLPLRTSLQVLGGQPLSGAVRTAGFKHSMVTLVAASTLGRATLQLANCPEIVETTVLLELLKAGGAHVERAGSTVTIDASTFEGADLEETLATKIHGSVYLMPAVLHRRGIATVNCVGGCRIGTSRGAWRPTEHYLDVLRRFGATTRHVSDRQIEARATRLAGCEIDLLDFTMDRQMRTGPLYSGASKFAVLCAAVADGVSVLRHLYPKPDVMDLVDTLALLGAHVERAPDGTVVIGGQGGSNLTRDACVTLMPDLIEVVTWIVAGAKLAATALRIAGPGMFRVVTALQPELTVLEAMGVRLDMGSDHLTVHPADSLRPARIVVASHGVYSDAQPLIALLACHAAGRSQIVETVWTSRFRYAEGLSALGASLHTEGATLFIDGPCIPRRSGQTVEAPDLRGAAVLLLAALGVEGRTVIAGADHLARGYDDLIPQLRALGASLEWVPASE